MLVSPTTEYLCVDLSGQHYDLGVQVCHKAVAEEKTGHISLSFWVEWIFYNTTETELSVCIGRIQKNTLHKFLYRELAWEVLDEIA